MYTKFDKIWQKCLLKNLMLADFLFSQKSVGAENQLMLVLW